MKRFFINVTQEDIDKTSPMELTESCPVQHCLLRSIPGARTVSSGARSSEVRFRYLGSKVMLYHSKNLERQIRYWDRNKGFMPGKYGLTKE